MVVFAKDLDALASFYAGAFGLARRNTADDGYVEMVEDDRTVVALHALPPDIAAQIDVTTPPRWREDSALKMCFAAADLDARRDAVLEHGGQAKDPWDWEGTRFCECTDPEGNVLQIFTPSGRRRTGTPTSSPR